MDPGMPRLERRRVPGLSCPQVLPGKGFQNLLMGRTGIAFFKDYWFRDGDKKYPTGDHIDLWNRNRLTPSVETFMRFTLGISSVRVPDLRGGMRPFYSDLENSHRVLFWSLA